MERAKELLTAHPRTPASLYADEPLVNQMGPNGKRSSMISAQGLRLATYWWPAQGDTKAVVQLLHGNGAYCMEFLRAQGPGKPLVYEGSWVQQLNAYGVSVCGHDYQGHGFSEAFDGYRSYFVNFDDLLADTLQFRRLMFDAPTRGFTNKSVYLLGISLGGCIALKSAISHPTLWHGVILLAPMISLEKAAKAGLNPYLMPLSNFVSRWFPTWQVVKVNRNPLYPELQEQWDQDDLNFKGNTRARSASEYLRATEELLPMLSETKFSWICFHGDSDTLCDIEGSKLLLEQSKSKDKELVVLKDRWHVLVKEPGQEEILKRIKWWIDERY